MAGTLYVVATPIGNLEDITYRAVRTLREVDLIACEDTRRTQHLLEHYGIHKPLVSYHEHNEKQRAPELVQRLQQGERIALVSDAGTPVISDPGYRLVAAAAQAGIVVVPIPGPSALLAALAGSGLPSDQFWFLGFLPGKRPQRRKLLEEIRGRNVTTVFYEAPHRILETLEDMADLLPQHPVVVARELTKIHEEFLRGTAREILEALRQRPAVKGEFTVVVGKAEEPLACADEESIRAEFEAARRQGLGEMDAIKAVAKRLRLPKRVVYRVVRVGREDLEAEERQ